ncbi:flagellar hook-associated protein FlgL [Clostridium butyricum]|uniref:Flagellar hook-associated protein 3 n=1 Tax=Clostridium butyricum TaxID=1492 RepID=A0AAP9RIA2_CLOBU|nr:flagellar hook-associated protein FlgL [Clostridium butyricum]MBZ5745173.1 flagellar hook-associated protein FlgL [Clostridium butyricum]MDI9207555.1 flagellar hook-associated protein FlgL [Clostridium butyricum]QMW92136.1 flagellar hook-associated protein 3 [Clostridium butyricum]BBK75621.1 flagellar hook-associated protein 3 [Clostridium butyricum]GEQ24095.1 flagellar hook-associated protein 3 [Clostridium butyricum]
MTRITNGMLVENYMTNTNRNLNNMQTLQRQLSSGKEINRPSDNPYKASRTMQLYTEIDANKQYNENIKDVSNWLDTTDTALDQAGKVFARVRELLVTAGNGAYGDDEKKAIQDEIKEKVNELSQILNTNFDGAYIFGGTKSTSKPVTVNSNGELCYADTDGNAISKTNTGLNIELKDKITISGGTPVVEKKIDNIIKDGTNIKLSVDGVEYPIEVNGAGEKVIKINFVEYKIPDTEINDITSKADVTLNQIGSDLKVEISQGVFIDYNKSAIDILEYKDKKGDYHNVMDILNDIITNLGPGGDQSKLTGECIEQVDAIIGNLLQSRSEVGAMTNRMESAESKNEDENLNMTDILSKTEDIDYAEKMMEYSVMQTIYMASLQTSAKILPTTILDYIR